MALSSRLGALALRRTFGTSAYRSGAHYGEGPGSNMPFQTKNKWQLLAVMTAFFGVGFTAPFLLVAHQLKKK